MDIIKTLSDVKAELKASLDKALEALTAAKDEVASLETQKLSLQAEVAKLTTAIEPLRKEADGQRRSMREIFLEQEKAGKELDSIKAAIVRESQDLAKRKADAEKVIEEAKASKFKDLEAKEAELNARIKAKEEKLAAFQAEWTK